MKYIIKPTNQFKKDFKRIKKQGTKNTLLLLHKKTPHKKYGVKSCY